ncbi:MAG: hypothetical protein V1882_02955 [Candidatus Omnitrophota bacterium]
MASNKIDIYKIKISKKRFSKCPKDERIFYIRAMNFLTDVGISQKLLLYSFRSPRRGKLKLSAGHIQTTFIMRNLAGLLYEGWQLIRSGFYSRKMGIKYQIKEEKEIKAYFKGSNIIETIRNEFAYHLDPNVVEEELASLKEYGEFEIYLNEAQGNCFYQLGEHMLLMAMMKKFHNKNLQQASNQIFEEILRITKCMQRFFGHYLALFHRNYLGVKSLKDMEKTTLVVPGMSKVRLPFFTFRDI